MLLGAGVLALASCAAPRLAPRLEGGSALARKLVLLPPENLSGRLVPAREIEEVVSAALREEGIQVQSGDSIEPFLSKYRVRYTGGVDGETSRAAAAELGVDGVLILSIELYDRSDPPRVGATLRLVSVGGETPEIEWIDGAARVGNDSPGFMGFGVISDMGVLERKVAGRLASSLSAFLQGKGTRAPSCGESWRFSPFVSFRAPEFDPADRYSVAVLPFVNETARRKAGDAATLAFVRGLHSVGNLDVVEPGRVRDNLLTYRVILEGGVSLDQARILLDGMQADLLLAGYVRDLEDPLSAAGVPLVSVSALLLDRRRDEVVWSASSIHEGDDGVFFFDVGRVGTASELACRMVRKMVNDMIKDGGRKGPGKGPAGGGSS